MEACFIFCSYAAPEIRQELGIRRLSQVWSKLPSWYLWLEDVPGAFLLEMRGGTRFSSNGTTCHGAAGVIRYFPPVQQTAALTREEAMLLQSDIFDETGTPRWEQLPWLGKTELFVAGTFELHCPVEGDDLFFLFEPGGLHALHNPGGNLFDRLVGMQAFAAQHAPSGPFNWGKNGRAAALCRAGDGERFLRNYLAPERVTAADSCDPAAGKWAALADRKPVAAEGGGCCCGH
jgi:hypothetical protein